MGLVKVFFVLGCFDVDIKKKELYSFPSSPTHLGVELFVAIFLHHVCQTEVSKLTQKRISTTIRAMGLVYTI
jgi:hypothetical protein